VPLDRQAIERRDFPISRRGYDPAAVDTHLRAVAAELEELARARDAGAEDSLAATASSHVQGIIHAAETAAAEIERQAAEDARNVRNEAARDAQRTRDEAVEKARAHVAAVAELTAAMLERVGAMDTEARGLIDALRAGGGRLTRDLAALESNMGELYDAASGRAATRAVAGETAQPSVPAPPAAPQPRAEQPAATVDSEPPLSPPETTEPDVHPDPDSPPATASPAPSAAASTGAGAPVPADTDVDGARLIALNMALNGEPRSATERYLAENFQLADRGKLVDEVYTAIEG
jgi:DivIVA domain-containing protein